MKKHSIGFSVVVICMLLLNFVSVAKVQADDFSEAEERAAKAFEKDTYASVKKLKLDTQFGAKFTQSRVRYREHVSVTDTNSEWEAWLSRGDILASVYYENASGRKIGLDVDFGLFRTTTEEEDWDRDDTYDIDGETIRVVDQKDDTEFNGWELKLGLGYVQSFGSLWEIKHKISYGRRVIEFERRNFVITGIDGYIYQENIIVDEKYTIDYLEYSPQITANIKQKWSCSFSPGLAYVLRAKASNNYYDSTIEAEEGLIASLDAKVTYQLTELFGVYIGALGEWQYLEGNTSMKDGEILEWPDNDLFTYGLSLGVTFNL